LGALGYVVEASTKSNFEIGTILSSATVAQASELTVFGLDTNTTYYLRAGALWSATTYYANTTPASTSTLALATQNAAIAGVFNTSVTVNWTALAVSPSSMSAEGYRLDASTAADFTGTIFSSVTPNVSLSTLTVSGLASATTYYFRVGSVNSNNVPNFVFVGSTLTSAPVPTAPIIIAVNTSSITVSYGTVGALGYVLEASTNLNFVPGTVLSSATAAQATELSVQGLDPNTTYFLRICWRS
jgi:phosphodiesterase/alkaline phosphatase D-like protein